MLNKRSFLALAAGVSLLGAAHGAVAQTAPVSRVRGTIESIDGNTLVVKPRSGAAVTIKLADNYKVIGAATAKLEDIKPGSFIGTATVPLPDGTHKALEMTVFPASMKGSGEGSYGWDLAPNTTMTNGTVGDLVVSNGRTMTVHYNGNGTGEKKIIVPDDVPVVLLNPAADKSLLKPGVHVMVPTTKAADGTINAGAVIAGENGVIPPM